MTEQPEQEQPKKKQAKDETVDDDARWLAEDKERQAKADERRSIEFDADVRRVQEEERRREGDPED